MEEFEIFLAHISSDGAGDITGVTTKSVFVVFKPAFLFGSGSSIESMLLLVYNLQILFFFFSTVCRPPVY